MKNCIKYLSFLLMLVGASTANAQLDFGGTGGGRLPVLLTQSGYSRDIINSGTTDSATYSIRVWGSTDNSFSDNEVIANDNYDPLGAGQTIRRGYTHMTPLGTDSRALKDIVGELYYFQMCIEVVGVAPICRIDNRPVSAPNASQPAASFGGSTQGTLIEYSTVTRNNEIPFDFLLVGWQDRALDGGPTQAEVFSEFNVGDLEILEDGPTFKRFQLLFESTPGVPGIFSVSQCFNRASAPDGRICSAPGAVSTDIGYRRAIARATQGDRSDLIRVEWPRFTLAEGFDAYQVTRCLVSNSNSCVTNLVASTGPLESFEDTLVERGERYTYTIDSCIGMSISSCDPTIYTKVAESELAFVGLVDEFEEDDNASQATVVDSSISQLHSFDSTTDEDWVRLDLSSPSRLKIFTSSFNNENVDTVLSLYDAELELLIENIDADTIASFSLIESELLQAGSYYVNATHYKLPIPGFVGKEANNYLLNIEILGKQVNLTPILKLLLLDD